jgi:hypothetical protein
VAPNLVSIDGERIPHLFVEEMLPWMLESPLFPNIALLSSAMTQSLMSGRRIEENRELLSLKARVLSFVNDFLKQDFNLVAQDVLRSVIHLAIIEVSTEPRATTKACFFYLFIFNFNKK